MDRPQPSADTLQKMLIFQRNEITEFKIYSALAKKTTDANRGVLEKIAADELRHYHQWKEYTGKRVKPNRWLIRFYLLVAKIFGLTFAVKMLEKNEEDAEQNYGEVIEQVPAAEEIRREEMEHEQLLVNMIDEERIGYISSMVLGLNDALVELTGALAGFTLALQNTRVIGLAGLITGIAASLSMAASEYLSQKSEDDDSANGKDPLRASFYTGVAYIFAVVLLVLPFFLMHHYYPALGITLLVAILIILVFSYFVSVVREISFRKFFWEMVLISLGVAGISFLIGWLARSLLNVEL